MPSLTQAAPPKSDQLNADDLIGGPRTIKVTGVRVYGEGDQRVDVRFDGDGGKPYKPCKSMIRVMAYVWGDDSEDAVGHSMTLYCDPTVKFGGAEVGGIRISHMTGLKTEKTMKLTATRGRKAGYTVKPLNLDDAPKPVSEKDIADAKAEAFNAAKQGKAAFLKWYNSKEGKRCRAIGDLDMERLQVACEEADAEPEDEDPFLGDTPSQNDG